MYYLVALGNVGEKYTNTRHNIAWLVMHEICQLHSSPKPVYDKFVSGDVGVMQIGDGHLRLLFPHTFMNASGTAVKKFLPTDATEELIVVYDDVDLAFGEVRIAYGKGNGGHNGIRSVVSAIGTKEFVRIRLGIAPKSFWTGKVKRPASSTLADFVLGRFSNSELKRIPDIATHVNLVLADIVREGHLKAMNQWNRK